jgi:transcriptional regulator with XRE-family HTH domain
VSNLRTLRLARGLSTHALAKLAGVPQVQVWRYDADGAAPKGLKPALALAAALHCKVTDIWPEAAPQRPQPRPSLSSPRKASTGAERQRRTLKNQGKRKTGGK